MSETITIVFHTGTDAFANSPSGEIEAILHGLANEFAGNGGPWDGRVYDTFGNEVGTVTVTASEELTA